MNQCRILRQSNDARKVFFKDCKYDPALTNVIGKYYTFALQLFAGARVTLSSWLKTKFFFYFLD